MSPAKFWDKCHEFDWSFLRSLDHDEILDGRSAMAELQKLATRYGHEQILNQFKKAHTFDYISIPARPPE